MKKIKYVGLIALVALALFAGCGKETAQDTDNSWEEIKEKGYFIVGLDDAFPPMGFRDEKGEIVGFDIDFAREAAKRMGVEVRFQPVVWDYIAQELNSKKVDLIWNGCTITEERLKVFDFTNPTW